MGKMPACWRAVVLEALRRLQRDDGRGFEDTLWLGIGDGWWPLRQALVRKGLIEVRSQAVYPNITDRGRSLLQRSSQTGSTRP